MKYARVSISLRFDCYGGRVKVLIFFVVSTSLHLYVVELSFSHDGSRNEFSDFRLFLQFKSRCSVSDVGERISKMCCHWLTMTWKRTSLRMCISKLSCTFVIKFVDHVLFSAGLMLFSCSVSGIRYLSDFVFVTCLKDRYLHCRVQLFARLLKSMRKILSSEKCFSSLYYGMCLSFQNSFQCCAYSIVPTALDEHFFFFGKALDDVAEYMTDRRHHCRQQYSLMSSYPDRKTFRYE